MLDQDKVYVLLCTRKLRLLDPKSWISFLIRKISGKPDHVGFIYFKFGHWRQAEATTGRVQIQPLFNWKFATRFDAWIQENSYYTSKRQRMISYAEGCEGIIKYDFTGLIWMFIYLRRGIWLGSSKRRQDQRQFCSEFIANCAGIEGAQYKTPKAIYLAGGKILGKMTGYSEPFGVSAGEPIIEQISF